MLWRSSREADAALAKVLSANAIAARGPAGAGHVIRDLSKSNAAAREEVARLAAEAALRDEENARLRAMRTAALAKPATPSRPATALAVRADAPVTRGVPCSTKEGWMVKAPNSASSPSRRKEAPAAAHTKVQRRGRLRAGSRARARWG